MKCKNCKHYHHNWCVKVHDDPYPDMERNCKHYEVATNADKIRAMTDEELATWIYMNRWNDIESLLEWLKQEAEE